MWGWCGTQAMGVRARQLFSYHRSVVTTFSQTIALQVQFCRRVTKICSYAIVDHRVRVRRGLFCCCFLQSVKRNHSVMLKMIQSWSDSPILSTVLMVRPGSHPLPYPLACPLPPRRAFLMDTKRGSAFFEKRSYICPAARTC